MIERQRHIIDFTLAALLRRKGKNGALLCVYILVVFLLASVLFFAHALRHEARLILRDAPEIIVQRTLTGRLQPIPLAYAEKIAAIRGVMSVTPRLWGYYYDGAFGANYTLMVPERDAPVPGEIAIGSGIARTRNVLAEDTLSFTGFDGQLQSYQVARVLSEPSQLLTADLILMSEPDYRALSGIPAGFATDLALSVRNQKEFTTIAEKIVRLLPDCRPIVRTEIERTYDAIFSWRSGLLLVIFAAGGLAFIIFAWDKASGLSAEERKEIGILKAIGWETSDILLMKFWEGQVISLTAFLVGTILAYLHVFHASSALFLPVLKGWSTLYPQFRLIPYLDLGQLATLFLFTVLPYTVATIIPSWQAATVDPDAVMRS